jgi:hypothetical protein
MKRVDFRYWHFSEVVQPVSDVRSCTLIADIVLLRCPR